MKFNKLNQIESFYFIGIGGVSMSALAKYLKSQNKQVRGYDREQNDYVCELQNLGIVVDHEDVDEDVLNKFQAVVYTDAIPRNNSMLILAKRLNLVVLSRGQLLAEISKDFKTVIAVAGCHGKTTCTAMLAHIFQQANKKFTLHLGGEDRVFSNFVYYGNDVLITEACEYKKNFLLLKPDVGIVLNIAPDHMECYGSEDELYKAYQTFICASKLSIVGERNRGGDVSFGGLFCDYRAIRLRQNKGKYSFVVKYSKNVLGSIDLSIVGKYNVHNALAATVAALSLGVSIKDIRLGLLNFQGVKRRFEDLGEYHGARCIADYAHHPDEISATIATAKKICRGNVFVVFQPHTYSRTKNLFAEFVKVLKHVKNLMVYQTFAAREYYDEAGSAICLSRALDQSYYGDNEDSIKNFIKRAKNKDLVLFLGAGDIYDIAKRVIQSKN